MLAIPPQRIDRRLVDYLDDKECEALLAAPDRSTWTGRRDYTFLLVAIQTGSRISELLSLTVSDIHLGTGAHISCRGKGRKDRITPLTAKRSRRCDLGIRNNAPPTPVVFPGRTGQRLSRDAIEHRSTIHTRTATTRCRRPADKRVTAHVLRHTTAMRLLHAGIDTSVIGLWRGHEHVGVWSCLLDRRTGSHQMPARERAKRGVCTMCTPWGSDWAVSVSVWAGLGRFSGGGQCLQGGKAGSSPTSGTVFPLVRGCFAL
ncbi:tyrosine-type recombinase/integrase [Arthrobacter sp. CAN_C5]|uniref:tyrosine-type recombinase/integrase n=1 Tax=Arthrobacter sp. CAN_C5 TaxID=2760706 RepID=UPI001AE9E1FE